MTKEEALQILEDNCQCQNDSFMDYTHDRDMFEEKAFWDLYNAIRVLSYEYADKAIERSVSHHIFHIVNYSHLKLAFHFDRSDNFRFDILPKNFGEYYHRLHLMASSFFSGELINDELEGYLNEDLANPYSLNLDFEENLN